MATYHDYSFARQFTDRRLQSKEQHDESEPNLLVTPRK